MSQDRPDQRDRPDPRDRLDLRLLPPAAAAWGAALLAATVPPRASLLIAGVVGSVGVGLLVRRRLGSRVLAAALVCGAGALAATAARVEARAEGPLPDLASVRATVRAEAVVAADPRRLPARAVGPVLRQGGILVPARLERVEAVGGTYAVRAPVVLFAQGDGWRELLPGQRIALRGRLAPAEQGEAAALLTARGPPETLGRPGPVQRAAGRLRAGLREAVAGLPEKPRGLVPGLVVGDTSQLPGEVEEDFRTAGLTHLTAVSGANVRYSGGSLFVPIQQSVKAAIYTRVSSDPQGRMRSVEEQEQECKVWAEREGWQVVGVWTDNDRSASRYAKKDRPAWQALMDELARGSVNVLMVWEPSRATRDRAVWAALAATCQARGVKIAASGRVYDLDDPEDAFQLDLHFSLATRESGVTRKRVQRAVRANAEKGRPHGKLLYGYTREYDGRGNLIAQVIREDQAAVIREAAKRYASGEAANAIAKDFNARGLRTPAGALWNLSQVRRVVTNPAYIGKRVHQGKVIGDAQWPAILDEETHYTCVQRACDPAKRNLRAGTVRHLLSGIALCGPCGGKLRVQKNRGYLAYICSDGFCVSRKQDLLDDAISKLVLGKLSSPDASRHLVRNQNEDARQASTEAAEKRARLDAYYDLAARGELTPKGLASIEARLLPELEAAEAKVRAANTVPILRDLVSPEVVTIWPTLGIDRQRAVVEALMSVWVLPTQRGARTFDPTCIKIEWKA